MTIRERLSGGLNNFLDRFGYAFIRINREYVPFRFVSHRGETYGYEDISCPDTLAPWLIDEEFKEVYNLVKGNTLVENYRCYELFQLVREVSRLPGDILEVGVWQGGTGVVLATAAKRWKPEARVWLCDTFTGVVKAGERDSQYVGGEHADTSIEIVNDLVARAQLDNVMILEGIFPEETAAQIDAAHIALCHVDVDVYESAAEIVRWVEPRMVSGACLVFDDYGYSSCRGITKLVDELRDAGTWIYIFNLNKHAILIKR